MNRMFRIGLPLLTGLCLFASFAFGQKTEVKLNAYGGSSYFRGSAAKSAAIGYYESYGLYGRTPGFAYSFEVQAQRVTRQKHLFGAGIAFEELRNNCDMLYPSTSYIDQALPPSPGRGAAIFTNSFINLNPYIGQRLFSKTITLDATVGFDVAFNVKSNNFLKTTTSHEVLFTPDIVNVPTVDIRPRLQLSAGYRHINVLAAYSLGLTNYENWFTTKAYLNFLRVGAGYRF